MPLHQKNVYDGKDSKRDEIDLEYRNFDNPQESKAAGTHYESDPGAQNTAESYLDANGSPNAMIGLGIENGRAQDTISNTTPDGRTLVQLVVPRMKLGGTMGDEDEESYMTRHYQHNKNFFDVNGQPLATLTLSYEDEKNLKLKVQNQVHHTTGKNGGVSMIAKTVAKDPAAQQLFARVQEGKSVNPLRLASPVQMTSDMSATPIKYKVAPGDTYEKISWLLLKSGQYARAIAYANNGNVAVDPEPGTTIDIPQFMISSNKANQYESYSQFMARMQLVLMPYLPVAKRGFTGFG